MASAQGPQWAGNFDCAECRRKRLVGAEFSKSALEKHRRDPTAAMRCKTCVEAAAAAERGAAAERQRQAPLTAVGDEDAVVCSACARAHAPAAFNRSQLSKGVDKQRCQECVANAEKNAAGESKGRYAARLAEAKLAMQEAEASGSALQKCATASAYAAMQAECVTGLKPIKLGALRGGRGRGRGRG
ncbi:hypothetical protein T492DRAFT_1083288 [Pavlovales sp. CCMP2436]|nr:hypothetical protein T492DRAFT_1083288 [Pavlovales sp. CCMP2436]